MIRQYHGAFEGRFLMDMSLHAEYTNRVSIMEQFAQAAKDHNLQVQIHLSETKKEHEECKQRHGGLTPAQVFAKAGVLDQPTVAAHCVWVEDRDMELMAEKGVTVATCPASNLKLGSGVCNLPELRRHGVKIAIGTDSAASNNNMNLWKELYLAALLPKGITHDPTAVTPQQVLEMATVQGCASQGRMDCRQNPNRLSGRPDGTGSFRPPHDPGHRSAEQFDLCGQRFRHHSHYGGRQGIV